LKVRFEDKVSIQIYRVARSLVLVEIGLDKLVIEESLEVLDFCMGCHPFLPRVLGKGLFCRPLGRSCKVPGGFFWI